MFSALKQFNLKLNPKKFTFLKLEEFYLEHLKYPMLTDPDSVRWFIDFVINTDDLFKTLSSSQNAWTIYGKRIHS